VSFVVEQLCGERVLDPSLASTTMLWDLDASTWSSELCLAFDVEPARLPSVAPAASAAGTLTARGAALTGLPAGILVAVGTGDDFASPLGAGLAVGELVGVVGTAEVVGARATEPHRDRGRLVETHAYPAGAFFIENPGWLAGGALSWLGGLLQLDSAAIDAAAASAPPGAEGVAFLPALGGAMAPTWDPEARGAFVGLSPAHGPAHLCRAVYEACAYAMRDVAERIASLGVPLVTLRLLGGGARSRTWAKIRADAIGLTASLPADVDTAPVGAALCAAVAAGVHADLAAASAALPGPSETVAPDPAQRALHDAGHARYRELAARLGGDLGSRGTRHV
jgi:xylulokinase